MTVVKLVNVFSILEAAMLLYRFQNTFPLKLFKNRFIPVYSFTQYIFRVYFNITVTSIPRS
jgi:hypothetical protein